LQAFLEYSPWKANRIFVTLQTLLKEAMKVKGCNNINTTGKWTFAVRFNLCRAQYFGRTAKSSFAVHIFHSARQKKKHSVKK
jgi:hypothetical protein